VFDLGDVVPLVFNTTDGTGSPANATSVVLTVGKPDGTSVTPAVVNPSTGKYTVDYVPTLEGLHSVRWVATGANASAAQDVFNVREMIDQLISLAQAKHQLRLTSASNNDDLRTFIAAAAVAIEDHVGKKLIRRTITGERHYGVTGTLILNRAPVQSLTSVSTLDGATTWNVNDLDVDSDTGIVTTLTGSSLYGNIKATYLCGMRVIPVNYLMAARYIVEQLWQTMRPFVGSANLPPGALEDSLDARSGGLVGFAIPNRALELLGKPPPLVA
jgi:hypothetical protein